MRTHGHYEMIRLSGGVEDGRDVPVPKGSAEYLGHRMIDPGTLHSSSFRPGGRPSRYETTLYHRTGRKTDDGLAIFEPGGVRPGPGGRRL